VIENTLGVLHNTTNIFENARKMAVQLLKALPMKIKWREMGQITSERASIQLETYMLDM
jgi:hypothetical protein